MKINMLWRVENSGTEVLVSLSNKKFLFLISINFLDVSKNPEIKNAKNQVCVAG